MRDSRVQLGTLLLLAWLCTGCKILVTTHNIGEVTTDSGNYQCPPNRICEFDVADIFFSEVFHGEATHPNYRFKRWLEGNRHFCGGSDAACALSTGQFSGNDALIGILESEEWFFLVPEFERIGEVETAILEYRDNGKAQVSTASGEVIGTIEYTPDLERVHGINIHLKGYARPYLIALEYVSGSYVLVSEKNDLVYENESCTPSTNPALVPSDQPGFGLYNPTAAEPIVVGPGGQYFIIDPVAKPTGMSWASRWFAGTRSCSQEFGEAGNLAPLVSIDVDFDFPLKFTDVQGVEHFIELHDTIP